MIEDNKGIPLNVQRLIFGDEELKDNRMLSHYDIEEGSTLNLVVVEASDLVVVEKKRKRPRLIGPG